MMSKAFVNEDVETEVEEDVPDLPDGLTNYMTPDGLQRLRHEFRQLQQQERPKVVETVAWAAGNGDRSENGDYIYGKRRLREIDRRMRFLLKRIETAEVVDPKKQTDKSRVFFGATVTYLNSNGEEKTVRIVGVDEARGEFNEISWISPVARALLKAEEGDELEVRTPKGLERLEVVKISYDNKTAG
jgi:transcription elongation factor GreB